MYFSPETVKDLMTEKQRLVWLRDRIHLLTDDKELLAHMYMWLDDLSDGSYEDPEPYPAEAFQPYTRNPTPDPRANPFR